MKTALCGCCGAEFGADGAITFARLSGGEMGICPQCRSDAAMGERARGMEYRNGSEPYGNMWNAILREIKEGE